MEFEKSLVHLAKQIKEWSDEKFAKLEQEQTQLKLAIDQVETKEGPQGPVGEAGPQGEKGADGTSVSADEILKSLVADEEFIKSITGPQGDQGPMGEVGPQGEKGLDGSQGTPGKDADPVPPEVISSLLKEDETFLKAIQGAPGEQGPAGEKGADGKSVEVSEVIESLVSDEDFVKAVMGKEGPIGIQGPSGEKGADGQDGRDADPVEVAKALISDESFVSSLKGEKGEDADPEVIAEILKSDDYFLERVQGLEGDRGEDGADGRDGLGIKAFEISDEGDLAVEMTDGQIVELGNIRGPQGKSVDPEIIVKMLQDSSEFTQAVRGPQGEMFPEDQAVEIIKGLVEGVTKQYDTEIELAVKKLSDKEFELDKSITVAQEKAIQLDKAIEENNRTKVIQYTPESLVKMGSWVEHNGRYYVANRDTDSVPGTSSAYSLVLRGFEFKKAWSADTQYERLDVVISATGSAWVANKNAPEGEPGSTPDWNLLVKRGERGAKGDSGTAGPKGEKGDRGEQGPAGKDAEFDLEDVTKAALAEFLGSQPVYEVPISSFEGFWHADVSYNKGAVVHFGDGLWVAKKASRNIAPREFLNSPKLIQSRETWQLMFELPPGFDPSLISGAINGFNNLTQQVQSLLTGVSHETAVLDVLAAPPANPLDGDIYMVGLNPTGAWAGQANSVAIYDAGNWVFTPPQQTGETHHVTTKNTTLTWNGTRYVQTASGVASSISATPPTNPRGGDLWLDTSSTPSQLKVYNGAGWTNTSNGTRTVTSPTDPQASMVPKNGDIWVKPEVPAAGTNPRQPAEVRSWLNGAWVVGTPTVPASSRTYVQAAAPTGATDGDLWIQHVTGQKDIYYHFIAGAWVNDAGTRTFVQDADPAAAAVEGDIWTNITAPVSTKIRHNGAWVAPAAAPTIPSGTPVITVGAGVAAARATTGDQYYNSGNGQFYVYDGTNWVQPGPKFLQITQAAYTALATKDSNTLYIIVG